MLWPRARLVCLVAADHILLIATPFAGLGVAFTVAYFFIFRIFLFIICLPAIERWLGRDKFFIRKGPCGLSSNRDYNFFGS